MTNAEAWFNNSLRPRKPEGSLGRTAQDVHLDSHTAPELCDDDDQWWSVLYSKHGEEMWKWEVSVFADATQRTAECSPAAKTVLNCKRWFTTSSLPWRKVPDSGARRVRLSVGERVNRSPARHCRTQQSRVVDKTPKWSCFCVCRLPSAAPLLYQ